MYPQVYVGEKYQKLARVYDAMSQIGLDTAWKKDVQPIDLKLEGFNLYKNRQPYFQLSL